MEWIRAMVEWARTVFEQTGIGPAALPAAFLLGLLSSIACSCCTLPVLGAVAGYSGTRRQGSFKRTLFAALFFMLGAVIATVILGAVAGFVGQVAQSTLGTYWKIFAGIIRSAINRDAMSHRRETAPEFFDVAFDPAALRGKPFKTNHRNA